MNTRKHDFFAADFPEIAAARSRSRSSPSRRGWRAGPILRLALLAGVGAVLALCATAAPAGETNSPVASLSLEAFKIISQRNIFDQNRHGDGTRSQSTEQPPKIESFSLIGTFSDEEGTFALFDGTDSQFRKDLKPGEAIAGFKIAGIEFDSVKLGTTNDTLIDLPILMQMKKQGEGPWQLVVGNAPSEGSVSPAPFSGRRERDSFPGRRDRGPFPGRRDRGAPRSTSNESPDVEVVTVPSEVLEGKPAPIAGSSSNSSAEEVLKKLMQKREQELNR